jgi:hypothetical protein
MVFILNGRNSEYFIRSFVLFIIIILIFFKVLYSSVGRVAQSIQRLTTGWTVRGSNPGGGEIFRIRPDRTRGLPSLLCNGYWVFPGGKAVVAWC